MQKDKKDKKEKGLMDQVMEIYDAAAMRGILGTKTKEAAKKRKRDEQK